MEQKTINIITYICIFIIILIIVRFIYTYLNNNSNEGFNNSDTPQNLVLKDTATDILQSINTNNQATNISWSNKLYNMQSTTLEQVKPISLFKPKLTIKDKQYMKLGDMLSQSPNYIPQPTDFTVLIRKDTSQYMAPSGYELISQIGNLNINPNYYKFEKYINNLDSFNKIYNSLNIVSNVFNTFNTLINTNITNIQNNILNSVLNSRTYSIDSNEVSIMQLTAPTNYNITSNSLLKLPAGISVIITNNDNTTTTFESMFGNLQISNMVQNKDTTTTIDIPSNIDLNQYNSPQDIKPLLPANIFGNLQTSNIVQNKDTIIKFANSINFTTIKTNLINILTEMKNIYDNQYNNPDFLNYISLANSQNDVINLLSSLNSMTKFDTSILQPYQSSTTILGTLIQQLLNSNITYTLNYLVFKPSDININNAKSITVNTFTNSIIQNISPSEYSIFNTYSPGNPNIINNISTIIQFRDAISNKTIDYFPLQIFNPIAPTGYKSLGHVFCNTCNTIYQETELVACIPENCVKEMRDWLPTDKVYEYNMSGTYLAIYLNPYTRTFKAVSQNQLPDGKVEKVIACVKQCTVVDDLIKADDCARKYYNINKKVMTDTKLISNVANNEEDNIYLTKIKNQSEKIALLKNKAQTMQLTLDKANIINREMNKNKLQNYVDTQKLNIELITDQLLQDKNKVQVNVNMPYGTINKIISNINKSTTLAPEQKKAITSKIIEIQTKVNKGTLTNAEYQQAMSQVLSSCPQYDLSGLVKKDLVSNVCYGCDNPQE